MKKAANWEWNHPTRKTCVVVNTTERNWSSEDTLTSDVEMQFRVCLAGLVLYFHTFFPVFWNGNEYPVPLYVIFLCVGFFFFFYNECDFMTQKRLWALDV